MKKKYVLISTIILISLMVAGGSMAWFMDSENATNKFKMGTVEVEVWEPEFKDISDTQVQVEPYEKEVMVKSNGTKNTYVRVRLVPEWSNPSLPVSNVVLNLAGNSDWVQSETDDGYYYFKYYLTKDDQVTSPLLASVEFAELGSQYDGETFTLKVVAEGVQITHEAWKDVWGLTKLPFEANKPWNPNPQ